MKNNYELARLLRAEAELTQIDKHGPPIILRGRCLPFGCELREKYMGCLDTNKSPEGTEIRD